MPKDEISSDMLNQLDDKTKSKQSKSKTVSNVTSVGKQKIAKEPDFSIEKET